jgi:hypothetical protein
MGDQVREISTLVRRIVSATCLGSKGMYKRYGLTGPQALALRTLPVTLGDRRRHRTASGSPTPIANRATLPVAPA